MTNFQTYRPSFNEILNGTPLTPAEESLLDACKTTGAVFIGGEVPDKATPENSIRGELIRYLMMGGCETHQPNARGVFVFGAYITGYLILDGCRSPLDLGVVRSRFEQGADFDDSEVGAVVLSTSYLPGLTGERMTVKRSFFMRHGFCSAGSVVLSGAHIGGQLDCAGARFEAEEGAALEAQGLTVSGDVFLRDGILACGRVDLQGAQIKGQLDCTHGSFHKGMGLQSAVVGAEFYFRFVRAFNGTLDLSEAHVTCLGDDAASWEQPDDLDLTGFRFDTVQSHMSVSDRLGVLTNHAKQGANIVFHSQPYTHLAKHFHSNGERQAAACILYEREKHLARAEWARAHEKLDGTWREAFRCQGADFAQMFRWVFQAFAGFGHKPMRAFYWALATVVFSMLYFHLTYINGQMVPNSDIILNSQAWLDVVKDGVSNPTEAWGLTAPGSDYETFSAIGYGFDLFVPLDALGQEIAWAPSLSRGNWGWWGHYLRWPIQIVGWVLTAIGAALLTGLIGRDRE
ncbi:hypothetical protein [Halocynthiibacter styelae]|uniref:Oxidoreductase n=1 Tax=Halocynthiibacter styelae TaxID=2761955 RepID=A0A8J7IX61_9RHOB|nr:hypothetical protein [Paenihalocynthiibacter styelae]MBI1494553.1 hypothetical protein [Paenihalocynthiibacter styelae]